MAVRLNQRGVDHARAAIRDGSVVLDDRGRWSEHQPTARDENRFIEAHGYREYGPWFLGIDDDEREETKAREKALAAAAQILDRTPFREGAERTWWYRTA
jgi:hypothetical protein